jgi:hypothetical protein
MWSISLALPVQIPGTRISHLPPDRRATCLRTDAGISAFLRFGFHSVRNGLRVTRAVRRTKADRFIR